MSAQEGENGYDGRPFGDVSGKIAWCFASLDVGVCRVSIRHV